MSNIDWSSVAPKKRQPTKKEKARFKRWKKYLKDSRLSPKEQHQRAIAFTEQGKEPGP